MAKPLRTCLLRLTHGGASVTLIKTTETAPRIRKGQKIHVAGFGVRTAVKVETEDVKEDGREITLQWVSFNAEES